MCYSTSVLNSAADSNIATYVNRWRRITGLMYKLRYVPCKHYPTKSVFRLCSVLLCLLQLSHFVVTLRIPFKFSGCKVRLLLIRFHNISVDWKSFLFHICTVYTFKSLIFVPSKSDKHYEKSKFIKIALEPPLFCSNPIIEPHLLKRLHGILV